MGVEVFEYASHDPQMAELVITLKTWRTRLAHSYILQVKTELYQLAELVRGGRLLIMAPTWPRGTRIHEAEMTAVINLHHLRGTAQKEIERQIRIFVEDLVRSNHPAMTGTVRYIEIPGGGSFGIVADNGVNYDPHNLPREFAVDGLRVMFRAIEEHARCPHRWGKTVRIIWIERLRPMHRPYGLSNS
jgi:hypothetical protein